MRRILFGVAFVALLVPLAAGGRTAASYRYELVSLTATVGESQQTFGGSANGDGTAQLELAARNRPRGTLAGRRGKFTLAVRFRGAGSARGTLVRASRFGEPPGVFQCSSVEDLAILRTARSAFARVRDARGRPVVRVRLALPYVRAPVMTSADDPPTCHVTVATLDLRRVLPLSVFARKRVTVSFTGSRRRVSGDTTYTTSWRARLELRRR